MLYFIASQGLRLGRSGLGFDFGFRVQVLGINLGLGFQVSGSRITAALPA